MYFDVRTFLRQKLYAATHGAGDGPWLLTAAQVVLYPLVHLCFGLDELLHPEIAATPVRSPLFIVSSPRTGSTLLLHLLAADPENACYHLRELIFPSPTLRAVLPARFEAWADGVFQRRFAGLDGIHPLRFAQPEEDEILFLLLGSSGITSYLFPYGAALDDLAVNRFWEWPAWKRERFGRFYHRCVQRLLWARQSTRYVSKSPHFLGKIDDLRRWYPDARFVYLLRSPYEWVPSALSMITAMWRVATKRVASAAVLEPIYQALVELARHGEEALQRVPEHCVTTVRYSRLVADPQATVEALYAQLGWPLSASFAARLEHVSRHQRGWSSGHRYGLEQFGLTRARIRQDFAFLFDRYGFDPERGALPSALDRDLRAAM